MVPHSFSILLQVACPSIVLRSLLFSLGLIVLLQLMQIVTVTYQSLGLCIKTTVTEKKKKLNFCINSVMFKSTISLLLIKCTPN